MMDSVEKTKLITKLIKIISEKERQLSKYRQAAKQQQHLYKHTISNYQSPIDDKIKEEFESATLEVKSIQARLAQMEESMTQLTLALNEEVAINAASQQKIKQLEQREQQHLAKIKELNDRVAEEEERRRQWLDEKEAVSSENKRLSQRIDNIQVERHYEHILQRKIETLTKTLIEFEKFAHKIGQSIDAIHAQYCQETTKKVLKSVSSKSPRLEELTCKLNSIQHCLREHTALSGHEPVLNDTIDGLSIIMESFEDKLHQVACLTDRKNQGPSTQKKGSVWKEPMTCDGESQKMLSLLKDFKENINFN